MVRAILAMPSMQILVLALIALGTIVGTVDVISVAFAEQQDPRPLPRLFLYAAFATAFTTLPLLWVHNVLTLAAAMFVAGLFCADHDRCHGAG